MEVQENHKEPLDIESGQEKKNSKFGVIGKKLKLDEAAHPVECLMLVILKTACAGIYMLFAVIFENYVNCLIATCITGAIDFWFTKNIAGRKLVGLRWWALIKDGGEEEWIFESRDFEAEANAVDKSIFWGSQFISTGWWTFLIVTDILGLDWQWFVPKCIAFLMVVSNVWAFYKCSKDYQAKLKNMKEHGTNQIAQKALNAAMENAFKQ